MTWVRLDDASATHPKFVKAGLAAYGLWVAGLCYCNRYLTDGTIPKDALDILIPGTPTKVLVDLARRLCANRVRPDGKPSWLEDGEQYRVHDFEKYQPSKEEIEAERHASRHRQKESRSRRRHAVTPAEVTPVVTGVSQPPVPAQPSPAYLEESPKAGSLPSAPPPAKYQPRERGDATDAEIEEAESRLTAECSPEMLLCGPDRVKSAVFRAMAHQRTLRPDDALPSTAIDSRTVAEACAGIRAWRASGRWGSPRGKTSHAPFLDNYLNEKRHLAPLPNAPQLAPGTTEAHVDRARQLDEEMGL